MRPLEWFVLFSFVPALLLPFIPHTWRPRWIMAAASLPLLAAVIQAIGEGWRVQMLPLYVGALLVFISRLGEMRGRSSLVHRRRGVLVSVSGVVIIVGSGLIAGWLLPVIKLPAPTGSYQVGIVDRELFDAGRERRLMVSVWYPAEVGGTPAPLTHYPDAVMTALGDLSGLPPLLYQQLTYINVAASENVPVLNAGAPFPVLVFSHGMAGLRMQSASVLQELASWGYVVVAIDHTDAAAVTVFPDGEAVYDDLARFGIPSGVEPTRALINEYVFPAWVADQRFVYDTLEAWALDDPLFAGRLDLTRIGSFGHSFGGATSLEVCRVDERCDAAVNLDGALYGDMVTVPAVRPLLLMTSADSRQYSETVEQWTNLIDTTAAPAYWLELPNSTHLSFTLTQLLSPLLVPDGFDPRAGLSVVDRYLRAFFDTHLRGEPSPLLSPDSGAADVHWLSD